MEVIARAYGERPLRRMAVGSTERVTFIAAASALCAAPNPEEIGVGFPRNCVYQFEIDLFDSLDAAWSAGDDGRLAALWARAKPFEV